MSCDTTSHSEQTYEVVSQSPAQSRAAFSAGSIKDAAGEQQIKAVNLQD